MKKRKYYIPKTSDDSLGILFWRIYIIDYYYALGKIESLIKHNKITKNEAESTIKILLKYNGRFVMKKSKKDFTIFEIDGLLISENLLREVYISSFINSRSHKLYLESEELYD